MNKLYATILLFCVVLASLFVAGCAEPEEALVSVVELDFDGLDPLEEGVYEGWVITGEEKLSVGTFNAGDEISFDVGQDLSSADLVVITIEPENDADADPSGIVILAGELEGGMAELEFPLDLSEATGTYILATPTNGADTDEASGIWFLQLPLPPTPGLDLPELPDGWVYEGWVVNQGQPITSGRFTAVDEVDFFDDYSSVEPGPPFPGEDYLVNAPEGVVFPIDLADGESLAVISIEPDMDGVDPTGASPFQIKPLIGKIPSGAMDHVNYPMDLSLDSIPSGVATIS
ncbi:anti-sigma factor [Methanolobus sp. ZRKC3]|uniref:anti-sigma factor n=1 Tax=Methanolobus sp. ZRKC3 TaxID=3125786 RepID=UPI003252B192